MARKTGSVNHTHKYFRRPDGLWACESLDDCTHFMPRNMAPAPAGRMSVCKCGKKFQLTPDNMQNDHPECDACVEVRRNIDKWLEEEDLLESPTGLAAFGAKKKPTPVKDEVEVIEPDEAHSSECDVYNGGDCDCK